MRQRTFGPASNPVILSFEPGEDWVYCYVDDLVFEVPGAAPSPSHG